VVADTGGLKTSVVIATDGRCSRLVGLIAPLLADAATHEIIVVVDGCDDGSLELLERLALEDGRVVGVYQENGGAAAARATGVRRASGEIVLLLDDDVVPEPNLVTGHAARHAEGAPVVVGYMPVSATGGERQSIASRRYSDAYERICRAWDDDPSTILRTLWAGNLSLRRDDAMRIGLEGPTRLDFNADWDFGIRCEAAGLTAVFDRSLLARHAYERTLAELARDAYSQGRDFTLVHSAHPDVLEPLRRDRFTASLPAPAAVLLEFCRRPRAATIVASGLLALAEAADAVGLKRLQALVTMVLVQIKRQRGAIDLRRQRTG
jgi:glycosyltransferase involved in cell wall biosynthesis